MSLIEMNLVEFSKAVNSDLPAPGGGSVAAYVSNLGVGLARMLGHLTISKKRFLELDSQIQNDFLNAFNSLENGYESLLKLVDEDTESFNKVMDAFKLPKETEEEKDFRSKKIQEATLVATKVPLEAANLAYHCLLLTPTLIDVGNANALSDLASGMYLLEAGMNCSILNVKINASSLKDRIIAEKFLDECNTMQVNARIILKENIKIIENKL